MITFVTQQHSGLTKTMNIEQVLIIDDEMEVCTLLKHYLIKKNKRVACSTSLGEGIELFKKIKPDLLILDHNLPDGLGIDNIAIFQNLNPSIKIAIISAMSDLKNEALKKGANYFIEKPISFSALNNILVNK